MIPATTNHVAVVGGAIASSAFGLSKTDDVAIMRILRDSMYTKKVLAVLREYSANAWDAHREVGKHDLPIEVTIPTYDSLTCVIRDHGPGLSHESMFAVFNQYGASTKRGSNEVVGMLGIGSKAGFAYGDSFTVISYHDGVRRTYVAALDESDRGALSLLDEHELLGPCEDWDETGLEIRVTVKPADVREFTDTARQLFEHFHPRPVINIDLPAPPSELTRLVNGTIAARPLYGTSSWVAIMGCVPYRIDLSQLDARELGDCLPRLSGSVFCTIGEVEINASREELRYTASTRAAIIAKLNALVDEYVVQALAVLEDAAVSDWDKRLRVQVLTAMKLPLPEEWKAWAEDEVKFVYDAMKLSVSHGGSMTTRVTLNQSTRILIDDTDHPLIGYGLGQFDYVVRSHVPIIGTCDWYQDTCELVSDAITAAKLAGVTVRLLSQLAYTPPYVKPKKVVNPKHKVKTFVLDGEEREFAAPYADHWKIEDRVPQETDIYVPIEGFCGAAYDLNPGVEPSSWRKTDLREWRAKQRQKFFEEYAQDCEMLDELGEAPPVVYGYKTTEKKPFVAEEHHGVHYRDWRAKLMDRVLTPERLALVAAYHARHPFGGNQDPPERKMLRWLTKKLGGDHPIVELLDGWFGDLKVKVAGDALLTRAVAHHKRHTLAASVAGKRVALVAKSYPLLQRGGLSQLWGYSYGDDEPDETSSKAEWLEYVLMCDERAAARKAGAASPLPLRSVP